MNPAQVSLPFRSKTRHLLSSFSHPDSPKCGHLLTWLSRAGTRTTYPIRLLKSTHFRRYLFVLSILLLPNPCSDAAITFVAPTPEDDRGLWAFEAGCAFITNNKIQNIIFAPKNIHVESGNEGGEVYTFTASRRLGELHWEIGNSMFRPQMELPLTLEIVDEHDRESFLDYNAAFMMRWIDFPWNEYIETSFAMGVDLSYSSKVYLMDRATHPDDPDRSHLKIYWPLQWTFGLHAYLRTKSLSSSPINQGGIFSMSGESTILASDTGGISEFLRRVMLSDSIRVALPSNSRIA